MEQSTYGDRLRYLDANNVDDSDVDFAGLEVRGLDNEKLGDIDGFIVDSSVGRVYYAVVDSGGWFSSRRFLLPIGHAAIASDRKAIHVDVAKEALKRYPQFEESQFRSFSDEDLRTFESRMAAACCPDDPLEGVASVTGILENRRHYRQPDWWRERPLGQERFGPVTTGTAAAAGAGGRAARPYNPEEPREQVVAREGGDVSPHFEGRAQPGDVLGIETGGERTGIGDRAEDENVRRQTAERAARDDDS
jgi:hypothetical protein